MSREPKRIGRQRIRPVDIDGLNYDQEHVLGNVPKVNGKLPNIYSTLSYHPSLLQRLMWLGAAFQDGHLTATDRELVVLTVASMCNSRYVLEEHAEIASRVGLTDDQIEAFRRDTAEASSSIWNGHERNLITFVRDLIEDDAIDDCSWNSISFCGDPVCMLELISLIGFYRMMADVANAVRLEMY